MANDDLPLSGSPFTGAAEIARLLGRIEGALIDIRGDIQASTEAQKATNREMGLIDRRVIALESKEDSRKRISRITAGIALGLLIPALSAVNNAHAWFNAVNDIIFPRK
jgi:hypothetical protein